MSWPEYYTEAKKALAGFPDLMEKVYAERPYADVPSILAFALDEAYAIPGTYRILHISSATPQIAGPREAHSHAVEPEQMLSGLIPRNRPAIDYRPF